MPKQTAMILVLSMGASFAFAQPFDSGSDGSYGAISCTSGTCTLDMPSNGIFHCTTITVGSGATLKFRKNLFNTPVYLLATGDINIIGTIDITGGSSSSNPPAGGVGGPGGFDGGNPGLGTQVPPSDGRGPGAGLAGGPGDASDQGAGGGSFGQSPDSAFLTSKDGAPYGNPMCFPFVGGSGGGGSAGNPGVGGGGGAGAILLASNTRVTIGQISAWGGTGGSTYNSGSGGAVRIVAPTVSGTGSIFVYGYPNGQNFSGPGRIRIDTSGPRPSIAVNPPFVASIGNFMKVFPTPMPRLDIIHAAGQDIAEDEPEPVLVQLPFGSPTMQTVTVQARNFVSIVPIRVVATPEHGSRVVVDTEIDMTNVGLGDPGEVSLDIDLPINTPTRIHAWTR